MFRRLQNRLTAAANGMFGESDVSRLVAMGFTPQQAESALEACNGSVDRAAELLLASGGGSAHHPQQTPTQQQSPMVVDLTGDDQDDDLQRAIQQSMQVVEQQQQQRPQRTAAMNKAAEAAERRAAAGMTYGNNNKPKKKTPAVKKKLPASAAQQATTSYSNNHASPSTVKMTSSAILRQHHPDVKLIPKLQDKTVEERILRTADRMKSHPAAVDTLHKALTALQNDPDNIKFRRIDTRSPGYQRSVAPATGAADFLATMGFQKEATHFLMLHRPLYDPALIYLGISALQQTKLTAEYVTAKEQLVFATELSKLLNPETVTAEEKQKRLQLKKKLHTEPTASGALLQIRLGDQQTIRRRFDGDDTVQDLLHWLGSVVGTAILEKVERNEWCLADVNRNPAAVLDLAVCRNHTLQFVGCWPSGRLELRPASSSNSSGTAAGESRGLASGASSDTD